MLQIILNNNYSFMGYFDEDVVKVIRALHLHNDKCYSHRKLKWWTCILHFLGSSSPAMSPPVVFLLGSIEATASSN